ncbi:E3 ubiquitin-protein ligase RZFP34-like isoform X3 [Lycium barbarum]|uniref:E3 ubiquitin-protein ligase RZFP34-like isoform X3 n=1 Tax=Lycium barbarum TaxID=112863 RepID=UPI00293E95F7|nr:E3 ubiquitin-protein ligase RZFP34-like isoform X3 [Lycium barbarum]XP_060201439.1 E3 ubiquitin-protein ligase RZFP34-like isoform X3 [Lycium barbarum]XP_060201441.1 E3 ubiquitin-protein ligase RZFP34-like isoform X3 [Lycium barbarum]
MGAHITEGDAKLKHHVVMRYLIAGIVIMTQRSFAQCVILNRKFNKHVSNVGFAWGSTFAQNATSLTMMFRRINTTVINAESAGCCYSKLMKESHICIERAMHHNCPVCFEYIFDTTKNITVLPCGHTMHLECVMQMERHFQYSCPVCSRSYCDMSQVWEKLDQEVASMPMPEMYQNKMVWILCNDCTETSEVNLHIVAHKCPSCKSYNTRQTRGGTSSCANITERVR